MIRKLLLILPLLISPEVKARQDPLKAFTTDYCTAWPEGPRSHPYQWKHCCLKHDLYFWAGGTKKERDLADRELRECVEETGAEMSAWLIYWGVRIGGRSPYRLPDKKWNNGWPQRQDYQSLSREDVDSIETEIYHGYEYIPSSLKAEFINQLRSRMD